MIEKRLQKTKTASVEQFQNHLGAFVGWLSGFELIKNFSIETIIYKKFNKENEEVINKLFLFKRTTNLAKTITAFLSYVSHFVIIAVTIFLVLRNEFSAGEFFIAVGLIDQLSYPIIAVSVLLQEFLSTKPLAHKMGTKFVVQTSTADGYTFNNDTYGPDVNVAGYTPSTTGEFTIGADDKMGFRTIVTNAKEEPVITVPGTDGRANAGTNRGADIGTNRRANTGTNGRADAGTHGRADSGADISAVANACTDTDAHTDAHNCACDRAD